MASAPSCGVQPFATSHESSWAPPASGRDLEGELRLRGWASGARQLRLGWALGGRDAAVPERGVLERMPAEQSQVVVA